jgi:hypothetical protein
MFHTKVKKLVIKFIVIIQHVAIPLCDCKAIQDLDQRTLSRP